VISLRVIKVGGALVNDPGAVTSYVQSILSVGHQKNDTRCILVHGGGPQISALHERLGIASTMQDGIRVTPEASLPIVAMVLRGQVNAQLCATLNRDGIPALGLSGADLGLYKSELVDRARYGLVGGPPVIDMEKFAQLLSLNYVPVCCSLATHIKTGELLNVNADVLADALAQAAVASPTIGRVELDLITSVPGVLDGNQQVVARIGRQNVQSLIDDGVITGGMIPKVRAALTSIDAGVSQVRIGSFSSLVADQSTVILQD